MGPTAQRRRNGRPTTETIERLGLRQYIGAAG